MISVDSFNYCIPDLKALMMADALLFSVYKWKPEKIRRMKLDSIEKWVDYAKKKMTFKDAYLLNKMLEPKQKKWWQKIFSK